MEGITIEPPKSMSQINTEDYDLWLGANFKKMSLSCYTAKEENKSRVDSFGKLLSDEGLEVEDTNEKSLPVQDNDFFIGVGDKTIGLFSDDEDAERYLTEGFKTVDSLEKKGIGFPEMINYLQLKVLEERCQKN